MKFSICPEDVLFFKKSLFYRYLASGDAMKTIATHHRVGRSTVSGIISEVCEEIWLKLSPIYLKKPSTEKWKEMADQFNVVTNFPNCVGAVDGKHVVIQSPQNSGSLYYNYKGNYSMVLMAACDATYCYSFVDIGAYGKQGDSTIFSDSEFGASILQGQLNLPEDSKICEDSRPLPFVFVGDEAFPLKKHLMRPYPGKDLTDSKRAFNYRLCRARRMIENTFGITANRWRILRRPIIASVDTVEKIIKAVVCLHNFVCQNEINSSIYQRHYMSSNMVDKEVDGSTIPGKWRKDVITDNWHSVRRVGANTYSQEAKNIREEFQKYFVENPLPWQSNVVNRG